ncbi:protein of unknown function DUF433 [Fibrisoma limi BUZ 3]|uniref:DUF433 domain-containing protein n=1 Tax=Fibrisoma limi BUZ 3 TaxID=1185876 RepID=I2GKY7_9BACT|nr:DUF433 domain-containing protein [Fibrisoma limi]CCH54563.1 protein of unknown function DUF433 [Fibrisoma limi BUZ 3]
MNTINWRDYITANPKIMVGKPTIKGTRITVELIVDKLAYGETVDEILIDYPHITRDAIFACLHYAADAVRNDIIFDLAA